MGEKCEACHNTGWYGDNGPGIKGNNEYCPCDQCDCGKAMEDTIEGVITRLRRERDDWHKDRDRVLKDQMPWMEMVEAVYPDNEYDFGEALAMIIKERNEARCDLAAANGILDEIHDVSTSEQCACDNIDLDGGYCAVCLELAPAIIEILSRRKDEERKVGRG